MCVMLHIYCQTQGTASGMRYVKYGNLQIQSIYNFADSVFNLGISQSPFVFMMWRQYDVLQRHICCQTRGTTSGLRYVNYSLCEDQRICSYADPVLNIEINVPPFLLITWQQYDVCPSPHIVPNTGYTIQLARVELRSLSNPTYLQFCRFCL